MFAYIFIGFSILYMSGAVDVVTDLLEEEELHWNDSLMEDQISENEYKILVSRLSKLPFADLVKSDIWYKLLRYRSVESLGLTDWQRYEPLIPYLPLSMLRKVNFTDDHILAYFGQQKLSWFQLPYLAEEMILRSKNVLDNEDEILKLGNIICGFTEKEMSTIKEPVLRSLLEKNFLQSIRACTPGQMNYLSKLVKQYAVMGPSRTWPPEATKHIGNPMAGPKPFGIREIRDESFSQIDHEVVDLAPAEILRVLKDSQLKDINRSVLLSWRKKARDLRGLYMSEASRYSVKISFAAIVPAFVSTNWRGIS